MNTVDERVVLSQTEVKTRVYVDIDAAQVWGFRPTVHVGADYFRLSGSEGKHLHFPIEHKIIQIDLFIRLAISQDNNSTITAVIRIDPCSFVQILK